MKHIFKIACISILSLSSLHAEETSIWYGGIDIGYAEANLSGNMSYMGSSTGGLSGKGGYVNIGLIGGSKFFSRPDLGFRIYGNFNYQPDFKNSSGSANTSLFNFGINADLLYNFVVGDDYDIGLFAGAGLGFNTYFGKYINDLESLALYNAYADFSRTNFDAWLNAGLRSNFYKYFGLEVGVRVPFITNEIFSVSIPNATLVGMSKYEIKIKNKYNVFARITFSF